jgi:hypothetical protein
MKLPFPGLFSTERDYSKIGLIITALIMPTALMFVVFVALTDYWGINTFKGKYLAFPISFILMLLYILVITGIGIFFYEVWQQSFTQ